MRTAFVLVAVAILTLSGCSPSGISRDQALQIALAHVGGRGVVVSVERLPFAEVDLGEGSAVGMDDLSKIVWSIKLAGTAVQGRCGIDPSGNELCPPVATWAIVVIDAQTGMVETALYAAPGER